MAGADNGVFRGFDTGTRMVYRFHAYFEKRITLIRGIHTTPSKFIPALFCPKISSTNYNPLLPPQNLRKPLLVGSC
jgi:hypothetical protein